MPCQLSCYYIIICKLLVLCYFIDVLDLGKESFLFWQASYFNRYMDVKPYIIGTQACLFATAIQVAQQQNHLR